MANKFIIPSPWDPGYAIPENIRKEGLERHAFVTQWTPRGTYDDPDPYDPSWAKDYAVPQYILDEGYGQGARVTEWAPRGSYVGQVPMAVKQIAAKIATTQRALGDAAVTTMPPLFQKYGQRAAAAILAKVRKMPPDMRKDALRKIMGAIDPTLYATTARYAAEYMNKGVDANTALELAMARAMSQGIGEELVDIGKKAKPGKRVPAKGQVGLGCYGLAGLGIIPRGNLVSTKATGVVGTVTTKTPAPVAGQCTLDGKHIWKATSDGTLYLTRRSEADVCTGTYEGYVEVGTGGGGVKVTDTEGNVVSTGGSGGTAQPPKVEMMMVGPWAFPKDATLASVRWHKKLPAELAAPLKAALLLGDNPNKVAGAPWASVVDNPPQWVNPQMFTISGPGSNITPREGWNPMFKAKHPVTGEDYGVFFTLFFPDKTKLMTDPTNAPDLIVTWAKVQPEYRRWYEKVWDFLMNLPAMIVDVLKSALDVVGGLACTLLESDGAAPAAGVVGGIYGGPAGAAAGAKGAGIAQQSCGGAVPTETSAADDWILPAAIIGGSVLALALFLPKKKKTSL